MPISLGFWEWGCPKRGDAHIPRVLGMRMPKTGGCPFHCDSELEQTRQEKEFGLDLLFSTTLSFSYGLPPLKIAHGLNGGSRVVIWHLHAVSQKHTSV